MPLPFTVVSARAEPSPEKKRKRWKPKPLSPVELSERNVVRQCVLFANALRAEKALLEEQLRRVEMALRVMTRKISPKDAIAEAKRRNSTA